MKNSIVIITLMLLVAACGKKSPDADDARPAASAEAAPPAGETGGNDATPGVTLSPADVAALGVVTAAVATTTHVTETEGFGVVLDHDRIAQVVADVDTARAAVHQSRATLERLQRLAGTEGAETQEAVEAAVRQAAADAAALALAERKAATVLGQHPPELAGGSGSLRERLASGRSKLIRVTFPLGSLPGDGPTTLRLARLDGRLAAAQWRTRSVWAAPADPEVPGRSFFATLDGEDPGEGEHLSAWAPQGRSEQGVIVPAAAVLADSARYWCYVERSPGRFTRVALDIDQPTEQGYFVAGLLQPGDPVVVAAAGLLLARELHPGAAAD